MTEHVKNEISDSVMTLTLQRPEKKNALMREHQRIAAQIAAEGDVFKERLTIPEAREAFAAFAERRPPDFSKLST